LTVTKFLAVGKVVGLALYISVSSFSAIWLIFKIDALHRHLLSAENLIAVNTLFFDEFHSDPLIQLAKI
jgi:hypothetical protein